MALTPQQQAVLNDSSQSLTGQTREQRLEFDAAKARTNMSVDGLPETEQDFITLNPNANALDVALFLTQKQTNYQQQKINDNTGIVYDPENNLAAVQDAGAATLKGVTSLAGSTYQLADLGSQISPASLLSRGVNAHIGANIPTSLDEAIARVNYAVSGDYSGLADNFGQTRDIITDRVSSDTSVAQKEAIAANQKEFAVKSEEEYKQDLAEGTNEYLAKAKQLGRNAANTIEQYIERPQQIVEEAIESTPEMLLGGVAGKATFNTVFKGRNAAAVKRYLANPKNQSKIDKLQELSGAGTAAISEAMSNAVDAKDSVLKMSEKQLTEESPLYSELRAKGLSHEEARMKVSDTTANAAAAFTLPAAFGASKLSGAGKLEGKLFTPNSSLGGLITRTTGNVIKESAEEAVQSGTGQFAQNLATKLYAKQSQDLSENVGEAIGQGTIVGGATGGGITALQQSPEAVKEVANTVNKAVGSTVKGVANVVNKATESDTVREAKKTGDVSIATNVEADNYTPKDALATLMSKEFVPVREENDTDETYLNKVATYSDEINTHLNNELGEVINLVNEAKQDGSKAELSKVRLDDFKVIKKQAEGLVDALNQSDVDKVIELIGSEDATTSQEAKDITLGSMRQSLDKVTLEQAESLLESDKLTDIERAEVQSYVNTKKTFENVSQDIVNGSEGYLGISDYQGAISTAISSNDIKLAQDSFTGLNNFANDIQTKANLINAAFNKAKKTNTNQEVRHNNKTYDIHKGSDNSGFITTLNNEAKALNQAVEDSSSLFNSAFGTEPTREVLPDAATKPTTTGSNRPVQRSATRGSDKPTRVDTDTKSNRQSETQERGVVSEGDGRTDVTNKPVGNTDTAVKDTLGITDVADISDELKSKFDALGQEPANTQQELSKPNRSIIAKGKVPTGKSTRNLFSVKETKSPLSTTKDIYEEAEVNQDAEPYAKRLLKTKNFTKFVRRAINETIEPIKEIYNASSLAHLFADEDKLSDGMAEALPTNVVNTVSIATLAWLDSADNSVINVDADDAKKILGITEPNVHVRNPLLAKLSEGGVPAYLVKQSIGRDIIKSLGIKPSRTNADINTTARLEESFGALGLAALYEAGIVEDTIIASSYINNNLFVTEGNKVTVDAPLVLVKTKDGAATKKAKQLAKELRKDFDTIYGFISKPTFPTFEPVLEAPTTVNRGTQKLTKSQQDVVKRYNSIEYGFTNEVRNIYNNLGKEFLMKVEGYSELPRHKVFKDSQLTKNKAIERSVDNLMEFMNDAQDKSFYFNTVVDSQMRQRISNNAVNPQANKLHRHSIIMKDWESVISTDEDRKLFKVAIGQAFDVKVDKQSIEKSVQEVDALMGQEFIQDAVEALKYAMNNPEGELLKQAQDAILFAVNELGEASHSLAGLIALMNYSDTEEFTTNIFLEVDGITNGSAFANMQQGVTNTNTLDRVGIHGGNYNNFAEYKEDGNPDNYEALINTVKDLVSTNKLDVDLNKMNAISVVLRKDLTKEVADYGLTRNLAKSPVMIYNYGAGMAKIMADTSDNFVTAFYEHLEKLAKLKEQGKDYETGLDVLNQSLDSIDSKIPKVGKNQLLTYELDDSSVSTLTESIKNTYGELIKEAMDINYGASSEYRNNLNKTIASINEVFKAIYVAELNKIREQKGFVSASDEQFIMRKLQKLRPAYQHAQNNETIGTYYTKIISDLKSAEDGDKAAVQKALRGMLNAFRFNGDFAQERALRKATFNRYNKFKDSDKVSDLVKSLESLNNKFGSTVSNEFFLDLVQKENVIDRKSSVGATETKLKRPLKGSRSKKFMSHKAADTVIGEVGARGVVLGIQQLDASTMNGLLSKSNNSLNVFDAKITGIKDIVETTKILNESFTNTNLNYALHAAIYNSYNMMLANVPKEYSDLISNMEPVSSKGISEENANARKVVDSVKAINQYYFEGGEYSTKANTPNTSKEAVDSFVEAVKNNDETVYNSSRNFNTNQTKVKQYQLDSSSITSLMSQLSTMGVVSNSKHSAYLSNLVGNVYGRFIEPLKLKVGQTLSETAGQYNQKNREILIDVNQNSVAASSIEMAADEVLAHEVIHSITAAGLNKTTEVSRDIAALYNKVRRTIKVEDIAPNGVVTPDVQARFDYVFNNPDKVPGSKYSVGIHEFVAMGLTNEAFINALSKIDTKTDSITQGDFMQRLINLFERLVDILSGKVFKTREPSADKQLVKLVSQLARHEQKAHQKVYVKTFADRIDDELGNGIRNYILEPFAKFLERDFFTNNRFGVVQGISSVTRLVARGNLEEFRRTLNKVSARLGATENNLFTSIINEIGGRSEENNWAYELARESKKAIDQARVSKSTKVKEILLKQFGRELSKEEEIGLTRVLLKTDFSSLASGYHVEMLHRLLTDGQALNSEIKRISKDLNQFGSNSTYYRRMAMNLGNFMVTQRSTERVTLMNAHAIAQLTLLDDKKPLGDTELAENLIDRLATLTALKVSMERYPKDFETVSSLIEEEFNRDAEENGITFMLMNHLKFKEESLDKAFNGNKMLMVKGYTKEIFNPLKSFVVAPSTDAVELAKDGYVDKGIVTHDEYADDPNKVKMHIFMNDVAGLNTWQAGGVSIANMTAKGANYFKTHVDSGYSSPYKQAANNFKIVNANKKAAARDIYAGKGSPKSLSNTLVPLLNEKGQVVDYRYMMSESAKNELLEKNDRFSDVMGAMEANLSSKISSKDINAKYVEAMYEDYKNDYTKDTNRYVDVSLNSTSSELRELYQMLPDEMRRDIRSKTGRDGIYVKRELVKLLFGQRKFSVTAWAREKAHLNRATNQAGLEYLNRFLDALGSTRATKIEQAWQEIKTMVADTIVIKSITVLLGNIASNNILLWTMGVPVKDIIKNQALATKAIDDYQLLEKQLEEVNERINQLSRLTQTAQRVKRIDLLKVDKTRIEDEIQRNAAKELIDEGIFQSIVEDVDVLHDDFSYKSLVEEWVSPVADKIPQRIKSAGKLALLTHDTQAYKFLRKLTMTSDFAARYALHQHNLSKGMDRKASLDFIEDTFVNYDLPTHKSIQYMNDMGMLFFTKFFIRIQKIIMQIWRHKGGRALSLLGLQELFGNVSDISDSSAIFADIFDKFNFNPMEVLNGFLDTHPLVQVFK